jgi:hypothetical protein
MIRYDIIPYDNTEKILYSLIINKPLEELSIINGLHENLEYFIEWLEEDIINQNIPDYSFENGIDMNGAAFQRILFGSKKSKIAEFKNEQYIAGQEFDTMEFLEVCKAWWLFLINHQK